MNKFGFFVKYNVIDYLRFSHYRKNIRVNSIIAFKESGKKTKVSDIVCKCYPLKATLEDYFWFKMHSKSFADCETFITLGRHKDLYSKINKKENKRIFGDKLLFNEIFKEYIKRDFLDLRVSTLDDFKVFVSKHPIFISKPAGGSSGYKVEKKNVKDYSLIEDLYSELLITHCYDVEEFIVQHSEMARLHPSSVNTVRIMTVKKGGIISFFKAAIRIGTGENIADNFNKGGIGCSLDDFGIINSHGITKDMDTNYNEHPDTHIKLIGFQVPNFEIAKETCIKAAAVLDMDVIGFDVAITDDDCKIVEANSTPLYDLTQMPLQKGEYHELLKALGLK